MMAYRFFTADAFAALQQQGSKLSQVAAQLAKAQQQPPQDAQSQSQAQSGDAKNDTKATGEASLVASEVVDAMRKHVAAPGTYAFHSLFTVVRQ